jgi:phosphoglycolate phosphatase
VFAKELTKRVKVFTAWDSEKYMLGCPGDYLLVRYEDRNDVYILERDVFFHTYERENN